MSDRPLSGKVALVTGAGRGIGRAIAIGFAEAGARLILVSRTLEQIEATAEQIRAKGGTATPIPCDVTDLGHVEALAGRHEVLLAHPFDQSRIPEDQRFSSDEVARQLRAGGTTARAFTAEEGVEAMVEYLASQARSGDVILLMSNGGFDGIYAKLLGALQK